MDEDRRKTLLTLVDLAEGFDPVGCWDPERAISLLRSESTAEELREIGAPESLVERIWQGASVARDR